MSSGAAKPRRIKSAKARLTPTHPPEGRSSPVNRKEVSKDAQERVLSAKAIRDKHHGSTKVFPRPASRASKERFSSVYSKDFEGSFAPAAELRPTSPTRRHNPHPGKVRKSEHIQYARRYVCRQPLPPFRERAPYPYSICPLHSLRSNLWYGDCLTGKLEFHQIQWASNYLQNTSREIPVRTSSI